MDRNYEKTDLSQYNAFENFTFVNGCHMSNTFCVSLLCYVYAFIGRLLNQPIKLECASDYPLEQNILRTRNSVESVRITNRRQNTRLSTLNPKQSFRLPIYLFPKTLVLSQKYKNTFVTLNFGRL